MNTKNNQRFKETHSLIIKTFHKLIFSSSDITVAKICRTIGINRSSFYLHFESILSLYQCVQATVFEELVEQYIENESHFFKDYNSLLIFTSHVKKYQKFYIFFFKNNKDCFPIQYGYEKMRDIIVRPYFESKNIYDEDLIDLKLVCFQGGLTVTLKKWVENECNKSPEEIAYILKDTLVL